MYEHHLCDHQSRGTPPNSSRSAGQLAQERAINSAYGRSQVPGAKFLAVSTSAHELRAPPSLMGRSFARWHSCSAENCALRAINRINDCYCDFGRFHNIKRNIGCTPLAMQRLGKKPQPHKCGGNEPSKRISRSITSPRKEIHSAKATVFRSSGGVVSSSSNNTRSHWGCWFFRHMGAWASIDAGVGKTILAVIRRCNKSFTPAVY